MDKLSSIIAPGTISYTIKSEIITGTDNSVVSLTRSLNLFNRIHLTGVNNVRIKRLKLIYKPRTGSRGKGKLKICMKDNRIDGDLDDPVINRCVLDATDQATLTWESCIWLSKSDFARSADPPLVLEMEVSECNMNAGYSIGQMIITVDLTSSKSMDRFVFKNPTLSIGDKGFATRITHQDPSVRQEGEYGISRSISYRESTPRIADSLDLEGLKEKARHSIGSTSARRPEYREVSRISKSQLRAINR